MELVVVVVVGVAVGVLMAVVVELAGIPGIAVGMGRFAVLVVELVSVVVGVVGNAEVDPEDAVVVVVVDEVDPLTDAVVPFVTA